MTVAMAMSVTSPDNPGHRESVELVASRHPNAQEMEAYERVLTDALAGDATLFARQDYVEEAWRIVDSVLKADTPIHPYKPGTWGPGDLDPAVVPKGGWQTPQPEEPDDFRVVH